MQQQPSDINEMPNRNDANKEERNEMQIENYWKYLKYIFCRNSFRFVADIVVVVVCFSEFSNGIIDGAQVDIIELNSDRSSFILKFEFLFCLLHVPDSISLSIESSCFSGLPINVPDEYIFQQNEYIYAN